MAARKKAKSARGRASASKRTRIAPKGDARYVRRSAGGQFKESDDVGRSQKADRSRRAKRPAKSGQGDRGDRSAAAPS